MRGNPAGGRAGFAAQVFNYGVVEFISLWLGDLLPTEGDAKAAADFLKFRFRQSRLLTSVYHSMDAAAPLLNEF